MESQENRTLLTKNDYKALMKKYFQTEEIKILGYEEENAPFYSEKHFKYIIIKIFVANQQKKHEVRFLVKIFEKKEYFNKELAIFQNFSDCTFNFNALPKFYMAKENILILEDIFHEGFVVPLVNQMNYEEIVTVIEKLAQYHALFFTQHENRVYQKETDNVEFKENMRLLNRMLDGLERRDLNEDLSHFILSFKNCKSPLTSKFLCHSFLHERSSVLLKYDVKGKPIECKLLNFEFQHYNDPTLDFLQFIFRSTDQEMRQHNLKRFVDLYYDHLKNGLKSKGLCIETIFPRKEQFEISLYKLLPLVKIQAICIKLSDKLQNSSKELYAFIQNKQNENFINELIFDLGNVIKNSKLTLEDCYIILQNKLGSTDYKLLNYSLKPLDRMSGYLGDHNKLAIDILLNNKKTKLNLFAKFTPSNEAAMKVVLDSSASYKEMFFFEEIVSLLHDLNIKLLDDVTVPCYFSRLNNVVVFEDIDFEGFSALDPRVPLDYDLVCLVIKKFAKFHAASVVLEEKLSEKSKNKKYNLKKCYPTAFQESFFVKVKDHMGAQNMQAGINAVEHILSLYREKVSIYSKEKINIKMQKAFDRTYELVKESKKFRNVICHGDLWATNVMVKFNEGKPMDCRFIDFQLYRYCPPAHDILIFLYLTTNRDFRRRYLNEVLNLYHDELTKNLNLHEIDVESIMTREQFKESVDYMLPQAVCQTIIYFQLALINQEVMKEYVVDEETAGKVLVGDRREFITTMFQRDPLFKERLGESVDDLLETCEKYF